jgi:hypothetical protein
MAMTPMNFLSAPRLPQAAHDFEGQTMKELPKPIADGDSLTGTESDDADAGSQGALSEFAPEAMGRALSEHGGLGIAKPIVKEPASNQHGARR